MEPYCVCDALKVLSQMSFPYWSFTPNRISIRSWYMWVTLHRIRCEP